MLSYNICLCLTSFNFIISRPIHVAANDIFFLWLNSILCVYIYVCVCLYIYLYTHTYVYMYLLYPFIFFIHSSVVGQPGCCHALVGCLITKLYSALVTSWTVCQAPLSMGFSKQKYWSRLPFPSPGGFPDPGVEPRSPALQADSLPTLRYEGDLPCLGYWK